MTGAKTLDYSLERTGLSPLADLQTLVTLTTAFVRLRPGMVITFQPKPNVYGILAAALARVPRRYAVVEGLGFAFTPGEESLKKRLVRVILKGLYWLSFSLAHKVFFLNPDDLEEFVSGGLVSRKKAVLLGGIGVPLEDWPPAPPHLEPLTFTLIARLLREKGVREFAEAARRVKALHPETRFLLIGPLDNNPGAIGEEEVRAWVKEGILEWVPWTEDVRPYLRQTSVYVLPSYYREGVPRSTQEAMAMARPVITTDVPGCRETVVPGVNGFLVPPRDIQALVEAMERLILEPSLVEKMGKESRRLAEERFDSRKVNERFLRELGLE
ncbi:glycosyltransferase family 4 protein [Thermus thalpophilus]